ncbi:PBECR4 domain-containing protein [Bacillus cereus group sp. BceL297]|uniref:PBECR4 domain-containing protein n=1 Tax=unclassified Bacillus cereus group TaxID=2750818 RepID=UPI003F26F62E
MNDKQTLDALKKGQAAYEQVINQELHYVFLNKKTNLHHELIFAPKKHHFRHLCGINYYDRNGKKQTANQFYDELKRDRIYMKGLKKENTANQKLQIIHELRELTTCRNLSIINERTIHLKLEFDKAIRTRRNVFGIALHDGGYDFFVPKSLLNLRNNPGGPTLKPGHPVQCIYSVDKKTKDIQILCKTAEFVEYEKTKKYAYKSAPQPA